MSDTSPAIPESIDPANQHKALTAGQQAVIRYPRLVANSSRWYAGHAAGDYWLYLQFVVSGEQRADVDYWRTVTEYDRGYGNET